MPCFLLDVQMSTSVNSQSYDEIQSSLHFWHISPSGETTTDFIEKKEGKKFDDYNLDDTKSTPDKIQEFFDKQLECRVTGSIDARKVAGQLQFRGQLHRRAF